MNNIIMNRVYTEAEYILRTKLTVREIAQTFEISKSTVHKDLQERLIEIDKKLHDKVNKVFEEHLKTRHLNGGEATRKKYLRLKEE